ncbi:MAG: DMT family transporter [Thermoplasmata archaeon]|nr:MAG: DMT family transporter [Thermoplasmata archaeon]
MVKDHSGAQYIKSSENVPLSLIGMMGLLFAVFCWGLSFPLLKVALDEIEPITLGAIRYIIGVAPLVIFMVAIRGKESFLRPLKEDLLFFFSLGLVGITLPNIFQNYGMTMTYAHVSSIIQASGPIFTIILAVFILKEPLVRNKVIGTVIALSGTFLLVTGSGLDLLGSTSIGNFLVLLSAISYAISSIMSKKILEKYDPLTVATMSMFLGTVILAVLMVFESPAQRIPQISTRGWVIVLLLAMLPGTLALLAWYHVLRTSEVSRIILFIYLIPIFATAISYFWPGEVIKVTTVIFAALIISGVVIAQYEKNEKKARKVEPTKPLP